MKMKKTRRLLLLCFVLVFLFSTLLVGCGNNNSQNNQNENVNNSENNNDQNEQNEGTENESQDSEENNDENDNSSAEKEPITLEVFSNAANYQGEQTGWYGKLLKEKFNITLNVIAPQIAGDQIYKARSAAGDLGDIVIIDNDQLIECVQAGLVMDMTEYVNESEYLSKYSKNHFEPFNAAFEKVNPEGKIYALPSFEADTSPTTFSEEKPYSSPIMPWTYYNGIGAPEIQDLDHLLDVLEEMHEKYPENEDGQTIHPITLWKDWDTYSMENVRWLCNWYGYQQPEGTGSILLNAEGDIVPFDDDDSMYYRILKFYFDANQRGLVDPDSASQNWDKVAEKLTNKQVLLLWYSWQTGFYNSIPRGQEGLGNVPVPISDMHIIQNSDAYFGDGRVWCMGSETEYPERVMEFLDWYVSPEGIRYYVAGIEGFNYERLDNGKFALTETGMTAFQDNTPVPEEWGGGGYQDGQQKINSMIISDFAIDPETGEFYNTNYWESTLQANETKLTEAWRERFGAKDATTYYIENDMIDVVPNINTNLGKDSSDIKNKRSQCTDLIKNTSWRMVFAEDEVEFEVLWDEMKANLEGFGWSDVIAVDTERAEKIVRLREDALANME